MTLTIGRVTGLPEPQSWSIDADADGETHTITGFLRGSSSVEEARVKKDQLRGLVGQLIPVLSTHDNSNDGFYICESVDVDRRQRDAADIGMGYFRYSVRLFKKGGESKVRFQEMSSSLVLANDHDIEGTAVIFHTAGPVGVYAYDLAEAEVSGRTTHPRVTAAGTISTYQDITPNPVRKPSWSVTPANYYKGGCSVYVDGVLQTGTDVPFAPGSASISNDLVEVLFGLGGTSDGRIGIRCFDGAQWETPFFFHVVYDPSGTPGTIDAWHANSITHYSPEKSILHMERDADEDDPSTFLHKLDVHLQRGDPYASFVHEYTGGTAPAWGIVRATTDAATNLSPTGGSVVGVVDTTATDGNKWWVGSPSAVTTDTTNGGIEVALKAKYLFGIGIDINSASSDPLDDANSQFIQYLARSERKERAVRR